MWGRNYLDPANCRRFFHRYCIINSAGNKKNIDRLPSRSVFDSGREYSFRSGGFTNEISLFTPSETAESCLLCLLTDEAVLAPYPQGFFSGCTFKKYIYAPKEECYWSDEQLIEKYESIFERKPHN